MANQPPTVTLKADFFTGAPPRNPPAAPNPSRPAVVTPHTTPTLTADTMRRMLVGRVEEKLGNAEPAAGYLPTPEAAP